MTHTGHCFNGTHCHSKINISNAVYLIIIIVTQHFCCSGYSPSVLGQNVMKCGRIMKRRTVSNLTELKFGLRSFRPSSCHI